MDLEAYFNPRLAKPGESFIHKTELIPLYQGRLAERIKYGNIEKEVKCGKYYLRIWVDNRDMLKRSN